MTEAASQTAPETNPIQELKEKFDIFTKMYQTLLNMVRTLPIDQTNQVVIFHDFVSGFTHTTNYLNAVIQQMSQPKAVDDLPEPPGPL